jgi:glycerol uptake facilitator-like aquaporin
MAVFGAIFMVSTLFGTNSPLGAYFPPIAAAAALVSLILALGNVSGGHFNPLITLLQWVQNDRPFACVIGYAAAQFVGGIAGTGIVFILDGAPANLDLIPRLSLQQALAEFVATAGLMGVIFACIQSKRGEFAALAVGAWFVGLATATPHPIYANPVLLVSAFLFAGQGSHAIEVASYIVLELVGALFGLYVIRFVYSVPDPVEGQGSVSPLETNGDVAAAHGSHVSD